MLVEDSDPRAYRRHPIPICGWCGNANTSCRKASHYSRALEARISGMAFCDITRRAGHVRFGGEAAVIAMPPRFAKVWRKWVHRGTK